MDLLLIVLVAVVMLLLALRRRRKRPDERPPSPRPATLPPRRQGWSFSRHPREDWRYWRDLAFVIGLVLALLVAMVVIGARNG
ncbi:hypothetical protein SR882_08105 [Guyparkeria halophila]|uniref:LPXTG cell wall anchor domain-containing protein n=1 Tax=Guyparkeria halophila TaxID=47960 RepID=A0ABZ0YUP2_9GAMM|nr:hypothetical protein [Guyparkeria halophila]WQH15726.1 hypothetical protein SR882_08105 [Guyparkeria halophila]